MVGRVAFVDADGPVVLPVNYVLDGDTVLFCTSSTNTIGRHLDHATVAFEVDEFDHVTQSGWSVLVRGVASCVSARELSRDEGLRPFSWADGVRTLVIRVTPVSISGRRLLSGLGKRVCLSRQ
jgi:nitroimidazol reductase NimA-like FMN-containing flavoprotein (pyridoxamine 5'-phosphate oxidase superfamily)